MRIRVGFGYDVHQFAKDRELWLGGIKIDYDFGLAGHSDADVLIHALCDAILGAVNMRDIGFHFPDNAAEFKNIDSKILLSRVYELILEKGYHLVNADITIALQKPKIGPYIEEMRGTVARLLGCDISDISVKATTTEKLGFVGREEGIESWATVLQER